MTNPTPHGQVPAIQRYSIGYHSDEWGVRFSTPSGIPDASGSWVRYADHVTALAAGQATAAKQPGAAYAALPDEREAFEAMMRSQTFDSLKRLSDGSYESYEARVGWLAWNVRASHGQAPAQAACQQAAGSSDPSITLDFKQATELLKVFGGEPGLVTLQHGNERSHSGAGLYAWHSDLPEEGAAFLGAEPHDEAAPTTQPAPQKEPVAWRLVPADATDDMMAAFAKAAAADVDWHNATEADRQEVRDGFCPAYRAMLKAAPQPSPAAQGDALSDSVRTPLDSLHADAAYLIGRLRDGSMPYVRVIEIIRERIDAASPKAQAAPDSVLEDAARLDFLIKQRAYVVSDPDACPGYWLHFFHKETGKCWTQIDEHPTPRAAIDAAMNKGGAA